jgi:hypothetical protein
MKTSLEIINKLSEKEAVKLDSQLVELANIGEYQRSLGSSETLIIEANKSLDSIKKYVDAGLFILKEANKELDKSAKMGMDIDKQAKSLGIDLPKEYVKATEELRAMYKKIVDLNKTFNSIKF